MNGREDKKDNDLFFTCSLIEYIARKTKNHRSTVVDTLGKERISKVYELADIYHSDNIERVSDDFIIESGIQNGDFDNVSFARYAVPSYWDIGKVYKRLILGIAKETRKGISLNVYPAFIPSTHPLAAVRGAYNAIYLRGDGFEDAMFYGKGAGSLPTGSAVLSDIMNTAKNIRDHNTGKVVHYFENDKKGNN